MSEKATFGAGCFWKPEYIFRKVDGVTSTSVGYMGGGSANPSYEQVCTGRTGHAEVVEVEYDPERISYEELLEIFWQSHDPTQFNRQGPDVGTQYRSAVFAHGAEQEAAAKASRDKLAKKIKARKEAKAELLAKSTLAGVAAVAKSGASRKLVEVCCSPVKVVSEN